MALRLRRGTDTERQLITPVEGELVYVTDTKELYVGDGSTVGGIRVSGEVADTLGQLDDVDTSLAEDGNVLIYDPFEDAWSAAGLPLQDLLNVNADGIANGQVLAWDDASSSFIPANNIGGESSTFVGDLIGNVFADDSSLIVDAVDNRIIAQEIIAQEIISNGFQGTLFGQLAGSVFADDNATVMIDGTNNRVIAEEISSNNTITALTLNTFYLRADEVEIDSGLSAPYAEISNINGNVVGDLSGSVFANDSTLLIDGASGIFSGDIVTDGRIVSDDRNARSEANIVTINDSTVPGVEARGITSGTTITPRLALSAYNGTDETPVKLGPNDLAGRIEFKGFIATPVGDQTTQLANITAQLINESDGVSTFPDSILQLSVPNGPNPANSAKAILTNTGKFTAPILQPGSYADETTRDAEITSPEAGMIIFLAGHDDSSGSPKFQGYDGTKWVDLN